MTKRKYLDLYEYSYGAAFNALMFGEKRFAIPFFLSFGGFLLCSALAFFTGLKIFVWPVLVMWAIMTVISIRGHIVLIRTLSQERESNEPKE